ncbi:MAG TPA: methionyl-tRNA formyltransferase [Leptospiraceae bacterium]|nr:methionyl-tRNA formyltransferase [Leptospiraceae bacterium]HNH08811.1 methionyl-tRNA formyltransferase [Leptospiraceae bacterium]
MKIGFFGTPEHSAELLRTLVREKYEISFAAANPDKPQGRDRKLEFPPVKKTALELGIPVIQHISVKTEEAIQNILSYDADIYIVFAFGSIIPRRIFDHPRGGTVNLHGSLLPEFRGASPVQAAILAGYRETGVTLQYITEELDAGDIISSAKVPVADDDNFQTLLDKISRSGTELILTLLKNFKGGKASAIPQDHSRATFCRKIRPEDRKLDFSKPAEELHNQIRAFNPGNICFTSFRDKRVNVYRTRVSEKKEGKTGSFTAVDRKTPGVICGDGRVLILEELQLENKKVMKGLDFMNGSRPTEGEDFK